MDIPVSPGLSLRQSACQGSTVASTSNVPPHSAAPIASISPAPLLKSAQKRSCAACKVRRVKCDRPGGDDADCSGCIKRGWQCVPAEVKARPQHRNGKRVKAIQELLADSTASTPGALADSLQTASAVTRTPQVSESSLDIRLGNVELRESIMSNLLESFFTFRTIATFSHEVDFHMTFNRAGRRLDQLSDVDQVLCATLIAVGARCSDHPAVIGAGGLRITDLAEATRQNVDLSPYGKAREGIYRQLVTQALEFADEKGIFRQKSAESIATLMFLEGMNLTDAPIDSLYIRTCAMQVRDLLTEAHDQPGKLRTIQNTTLAWTAVVRDALASAFLGSPFSFSDDDLWLLRGMREPPPTLAERLAAVTNPAAPEENFWSLIDSLVEHIVQLCRETPARMTSVRALRTPKLDDEFARDYLERISLEVTACRELRRQAKALPVSPSFLRDAETLARTLSLGTYNIAFILKRTIVNRLAARPSGKVDSIDHAPSASPEELDDYWDRLQKLERAVDLEVFRCCREIVAILKDVLQAGVPLGTHEWLDPRSIQVMFSRTRLWAGTIVRAPVSEEGGLPNFSFEEKLDDLRWIARALRSIGWSSAKHGEALPWVEHEIELLEARRTWYYPAGAAAPLRPEPELALSLPPAFAAPAERLPAIEDTWSRVYMAACDTSSNQISPNGSPSSGDEVTRISGAGSLISPTDTVAWSPDSTLSVDASAMLAAIGEPFPASQPHVGFDSLPDPHAAGPGAWNEYAAMSDEALLSIVGLAPTSSDELGSRSGNPFP
ncbi:hypothetical protein JCM3774_005633 [Rhodotorula dairenensis]